MPSWGMYGTPRELGPDVMVYEEGCMKGRSCLTNLIFCDQVTSGTMDCKRLQKSGNSFTLNKSQLCPIRMGVIKECASWSRVSWS